MKNERFWKTSGKTMKNEYFCSNFEMNDIDFSDNQNKVSKKNEISN